MKQQLQLISVKNMQGTGKESGRAYSMWRVGVMQPCQRSERFPIANGFDVIEMAITEEAAKPLAGARFPMDCEVIFQLQRDGKPEIVSLTAIRAPAAVPTAAAAK